MSRFRNPAARDAAWGRYYARSMDRAPLAGERTPTPAARLAQYHVRRLLGTEPQQSATATAYARHHSQVSRG